jgi:putative ABC transport system permease protein
MRGSRLIREALVAAQVMLTIVLLAGSIAVGRAFVKLMSLDRGFDTAGLVTVSISLDGTIYQTNARRFAYFQEALDRVRRLPGVISASATEFLPIYAKGFIGGRFSLDGRRADENSMVVPVFADYFRTMGARILFGREFTEAEVQGNRPVAVISEQFARAFGPPSYAVGREITAGHRSWRIVGVVKGMNYMNDGANSYQTFLPSNSPGGNGATFVTRVSSRAEDRLTMIRDAIQSVDRGVPVFGAKTMQERLDDALARPQFYKTAVICFAAFALVLAVVGIYGIVSYAVAQRTHEMGVRLALGTTAQNLRVNVLGQGLITIAAGAIPGIAAAVLSGRLLEGLVEGARSAGPMAYVGSMAFIGVVAASGIWIATRPITRLDIVEILRTE